MSHELKPCPHCGWGPHLLNASDAEITRLTEEVERLQAEVKRLEEEADGEFVRAAVRVMQDNPGFDHHDYQDGITADDFEAFFEEDLREAWRCYEKEMTRAEAAEARVKELEEALAPFALVGSELPDDRIMSEADPNWQRCLRRFKLRIGDLTAGQFRRASTLSHKEG